MSFVIDSVKREALDQVGSRNGWTLFKETHGWRGPLTDFQRAEWPGGVPTGKSSAGVP